jgi:dienelactone hydrolase
MKELCIFIFIYFHFGDLHSQNTLDSQAIRNWTRVEDASICKSDSFFSYRIDGINNGEKTCYLKSLIDSSEICFPNSTRSYFTSDNNFFVNLSKSDTVKFVDLSDKSIKVFASFSRSTVFYVNGAPFLLGYNRSKKELVVYDPRYKLTHTFADVQNFYTIRNNTSFLIQRALSTSDSSNLFLTNVHSWKEKAIWRGRGLKSLIFNNTGNKVAILCLKNNFGCIDELVLPGGISNTLISESDKMAETQMSISELVGYNHSGNGIIFRTRANMNEFSDPATLSKVDIWSYKDPTQKFNLSRKFMNLGGLSIVFTQSYRVIEFGKNGWSIEKTAGDIVLLSKYVDNPFTDAVQSPIQKCWEYSLFNTSNGNFTKFDLNILFVSLSPNGKHLVYYNPNSNNYFAYNIEINKYYCITCQLNFNWRSGRLGFPTYGSIDAWSQDDSTVYLSDDYDLYCVDARGVKAAVNITKGTGKKSNTSFSLATAEGVPSSPNKLLLKAFNHLTKENGFYQVTENGRLELNKLYMGPYIFKIFPLEFKMTESCLGKNAFLVYREAENQARNVYLTSDFTQFKQLTFNSPQRKYNWLTSELVSWQMSGGKLANGVLYKPENFDSTKRYPVIVNCYEIMSDYLHEFREADYSRANINIPYFVSRGYIVFTPDIHYKPGSPGESAYEYVTQGVKSILAKAFIDKKHIGLQGHSFGGYEVNYIVTRSNMFTAAMSACGVSNILSHYNHNITYHTYYFNGQGRMPVPAQLDMHNVNKNSPLANVHKVNTPILIMTNKHDDGVPLNQGFEFFVGLSALQKKCWFLNYYEEGHVIEDNASASDFDKKLLEYFDFYLRNGPLPIWMK